MTDNDSNEEHSEGDKTLIDNSVSQVSLESEMKSAYLDYAMSVIVSRAISDLRDGLKPFTDEFYTRCMRQIIRSIDHIENLLACGDVMGKYHLMEIRLSMMH